MLLELLIFLLSSAYCLTLKAECIITPLECSILQEKLIFF